MNSALISACVLLFLVSLSSPLVLGQNEPSVSLNPLVHNIHSIDGRSTLSSEVAVDSILVSGNVSPDSRVEVQKIDNGQVSENRAVTNSDGSFATTVDFIVGPNFLDQVTSGQIQLKVVVASELAVETVDAPLVLNAPPSTLGANQILTQTNIVAPDSSRTFVVYNNPYYFYLGYYFDDDGKVVQKTAEDVAAQLAKFSVVSLHYTDSAQDVSLIKAHNPAVKVFAYFNPEFCYISNDPNSEYQKVVKSHPEWFLKDTTGKPITTYNGTEQVMDITHPGWRGEAIRLCQEVLVTKGFDGLYLDNGVNDPAWGFDVWQYANAASVMNWHAALNTFYEQVRVSGKLQFYNGQSPVMDSSMQDYMARNDGWMDEGYISYKGWMKSAIEMPQYASAQNKFTIFYANNPDRSVRHFYYTSALLSDGYFFYAPSSTQWFKEYGINLGKPLGQAYQLTNYPGVWTRDYTDAKVLVNPTAMNVTISGSSLSGYRTIDGKPASSITVNKFDGVIVVPEYAIRVQLTPNVPQYLEWQITNFGASDTWVAPYTILYASSAAPPYYAKIGPAKCAYVDDGTVHNAPLWAGLGWVHVGPGKTVHAYSQPILPATTKWSVYNVYTYYAGNFRGWLYPRWDRYAVLR